MQNLSPVLGRFQPLRGNEAADGHQPKEAGLAWARFPLFHK